MFTEGRADAEEEQGEQAADQQGRAAEQAVRAVRSPSVLLHQEPPRHHSAASGTVFISLSSRRVFFTKNDVCPCFNSATSSMR